MQSGHLVQWHLQERHDVGSMCLHSCLQKESHMDCSLLGWSHKRDVRSFPCVALSFVLWFQILASTCKSTRQMYLKGNFYNSASEKEQTPGDFCLLWFSCRHTWDINNELSQVFKAWLWSLCQKPKIKRDQVLLGGQQLTLPCGHLPCCYPWICLPALMVSAFLQHCAEI